MSFSPPSPPPMPPYQQITQDQSNANIGAMLTSNPNIVTTGTGQGIGSTGWTQIGTNSYGTPQMQENINLTPQEMAAVQALQGGEATAAQQGEALLSGANYGAQSPGSVIGSATSGNTQAMMNNALSYLNPFFNQQIEQAQAQLSSQGINPGSYAYNATMMPLYSAQQGQVANELNQFEPTAYSQAYQNYITPYTIASSELGLVSPQNVGSLGSPMSTMQPANVVGAATGMASADASLYGAEMQPFQSTMAALGQVGGGLMRALPFL